MRTKYHSFLVLPCLSLMTACSRAPATHEQEKTIRADRTMPPVITATLIASDRSWGNTEGPAVDSKGTLYFTSRGTYKGIAAWSEKEGARQYLAVATKEGPGGLWIDDSDNIYVTAT